MTTRNEETGRKTPGSTSSPLAEHGLGAIAPGDRRAWDVDAALARVAGRNPDPFKERLRDLAMAYRAEEDQHLSFDEVQALSREVAGEAFSAKQIAHVRDCNFCRNLIDTIVGSKEERDAFLQLVRQHEHRVEPEARTPERRPAVEMGRAPAEAAANDSQSAWGRTFAMAAAIAIAVFGGFALRGFVAPHGNGPLTAQVTKAGAVSSASASSVDWHKVTVDCEAQSNEGAGCDLLTAAAKLTSDGQAPLARPVFVSALEKAGVQGDAVQKIDATLAALPKSQGARGPAGTQASSSSNPNVTESASGGEAASEWILASAKIDFAAGRPIQGYERVASYVAKVADRPDVALAVQTGFIAPVREAELHRMGSTSAHNSSLQTDPVK